MAASPASAPHPLIVRATERIGAYEFFERKIAAIILDRTASAGD